MNPARAREIHSEVIRCRINGSGAHGLEGQGFRNLKAVNWNLGVAELYELSLQRGEGHLAKNGPIVVLTGQHTGRSASDKFVVRDAASENRSGGRTTSP